MSSKRLSKREEKAFKAFKDEFIRWQKKLQCEGYNVYFKCERLKGEYANISISETNRTASVTVNRSDLFTVPDGTAKHEACHLFLNTIIAHANNRFVSEDIIDTEWERLSIILEKVL